VTNQISMALRVLLEDQHWTGTVTELTTALAKSMNGPGPPPAHLAIWLRRHEPSLWWEHGISVRFSRNGKRRVVHLARREGWTDQTPRARDGRAKNLTVIVKL
jgi:hypothetical protein